MEMNASPRIERATLAPGLEISRVLTGLWQIADMERGGGPVDAAAAGRAMGAYVYAGLTTFDMADHYGSAEEIAGRFRAGLPDSTRVQLLTKWVPKPGPVSREDVRIAVQRALSRLQAERIDLLQFHAWRYADPSWLDGLFYLDELRQEGLIRCLGLTNTDSIHLEMAIRSGIPIVSNQVCYSLLDRRARGAMTAVCERHGIALLAFGTLAGGLLTERWVDRKAPNVDDLATWSEMKYRRYVTVTGGWDRLQNLLQVVQRIARKLGVSMANVASRYVLDQPGVAGVIIGARLGHSEHIADTTKLFALRIEEGSRAELEAALAELDDVPGDCGDEYRKEPFLTASGDLSHHLESFPPPYPVVETAGGKKRVVTGTSWEQIAGYCRAVRSGRRVVVAGSTATHGDRLIGGTDAAAQTHFVIDKIEGALLSLGATLDDVVRTRVFVRHMKDWEPVARAHGDRFRDILPVNTLVQATPVGDDYLVEIEADAIVPAD